MVRLDGLAGEKHLYKLVAMEYVLVHRGGRGQSFVYEFLYDGASPPAGRSFPASSMSSN